jgi:dextranase
MTPLELLPTRATYAPGEEVVVEARGLRHAADVTVYHLGDVVAERIVTAGAEAMIPLGAYSQGGYGVELRSADGAVAHTAVHVADDPRARLRYGFVADYRPDRDPAEVLDNVRRLHLTAVQFYDWAYRHADLLGGGERYEDALGQEVSLDTVRRLIAGLRSAGAASLGYAAVYAVGREHWPAWEHVALLRSSGEPYTLGDLLWIVDPAAPKWSAHLVADLAAAAEVGFDGFHLDQYGYPRRAVRRDGAVVDVARSFAELIASVRVALTDAQLVFNNVNDFPTWVTAHSPQDAVYIEVWPPHETLASLARVVTRARAHGDGKPVVVAAYQHVYTDAPVAAADLATSFTMATLYSHGATQLLAGEGDRVLVDPYYVRNHVAEPSTRDLLRRWYDFLVEHDELLLDPAIVDVTGAWVGGYNDAIEISFEGVTTTDEPVPGAVWRRVTEDGAGRHVVHLVNLVGQEDTAWDAPRRPVGCPGPATLRIRRVGATMPRVTVADPDRRRRLHDVAVSADGDFAVAELPAPHVWQLVVVDLDAGVTPP